MTKAQIRKEGNAWVAWFPKESIRVGRWSFKGLLNAIEILHRYGKVLT